MLKYFWILIFLIPIFLFAQNEQGQKNLNPDFSDNFLKQLERPENELIDEYMNIHKEFSRQVCTPGTEEKFWRLDQDYRGFGFYVPTLSDDSLDSDTVNRFIPLIENKKEWIGKQIEFLNKSGIKGLNEAVKSIEKLENNLKDLLQLNKAAHFESSQNKKDKARVQSSYKIIEYRQLWKELMSQIPFLLSFHFPVDHYDLRKTNDHFRSLSTPESRKKSNEVYFLRQIVQDGAQDPDRSRSDAFLRSVLDTITLHLSEQEEIITEQLRYDLNFALSALRRQLSRGVSRLESRLNEWKDRTSSALEFYKSLEDSEKKIDDEHDSAQEVASTLAKAREALKDFSLNKQAEVYHFWKEQPEIMRALFAIETILYNEVADLDGRDALERRDIAQVVLNRTGVQRYSTLAESGPLVPYLDKELKEINQYKWLNTLFREGEFSFTYYFIRSNVRIFCPEQTRRGRFLLRENLSVGLDELRGPNIDFDALRYFSRHSMQGRIDMSEIWEKYSEIGEREGLVVENDRLLKKAFESSDFEFYYRFNNLQGQEFDVVQINGTEYSRNRETGVFHTYRNPHFFRYYRYDP